MALKDKYFTISEAAEYMDVTRQTIARWVAEGRLHAEKLGREVLIERDELYEYERHRLAEAIHRWATRAAMHYAQIKYGYSKDDKIELIETLKPATFVFSVIRQGGSIERVNVATEVEVSDEIPPRLAIKAQNIWREDNRENVK
jgi:excisionase family DNA binding protein